MIIWSSSEVPETAFGFMDFLTPGDVQKFIKEKVVMPPSTTSCRIPKGIFKDTQGSMLQFIAYGDELNAVYPPKPKDPKEPWNIIWTVKERLKSTGMFMLGQSEEAKPLQKRSRGRELKEELKDEPKEEQAPMPRESEKRPDESPDTIKKLRGVFGF
jgi:hypothetical protein